MKLRKKISNLVYYVPFLGLLFTDIFSLYRGVPTVTNEIERVVWIFKEGLISTTIGFLGSLLVQDKSWKLVIGNTCNTETVHLLSP